MRKMLPMLSPFPSSSFIPFYVHPITNCTCIVASKQAEGEQSAALKDSRYCDNRFLFVTLAAHCVWQKALTAATNILAQSNTSAATLSNLMGQPAKGGLGNAMSVRRQKKRG